MSKLKKHLWGSKLRGSLKKEVSMKVILGSLLLGAFILAAAPSSSYAAPCGCAGQSMHGEGMPMWRMKQGMKTMRPGHRMRMRLKRLGLDEKQKEEIRDIGIRVRKDSISKMADIRIARIDLKDILAKDPVDMKTVEAKLKQIESMQTELRLSRIKAMLEVKALLTPEQRKKFREDRETFRGPGMFRRGMWSDDDGGARAGAMK